MIVGDLLLARVSGVSPAALDGIRLPRTAAALAGADAAETRLAGLAAAAEAELFALVPALEGGDRRTALAVKRDVHNGRTPRAELTPALPALAAWRAAAGERDRALADAAELLPAERARAEAAVVTGLRSVADGLALASPDFAGELARRGHAGADSRFGRSCAAYLSRTAVKTSPFSTLTTLSATGFADAPLPAVAPARRRLAARALALELLDACAQHPRLAAAFRYAPAEWVWEDGGRTFVLVPRHLCTDGFFHRMDRVADASGYADSLRRIAQVGVAGHAEHLAALGGAHPEATFGRLVATRLLRPVAPWRRHDDDRLGPLADALAPVDGALAEQVRAIAGGDVRRRGRDALAAAGGRPPRWLESAALVHEDVVAADPVAALPASVRADLERLAAHLRPRIVRTAFYDRLVDHFRARYAAGGRADVVDYLSSFMARPDLPRLVRESMAADAAAFARPDGRAGDVGPGSAAPSAAVFFSVAADSPQALAAGRYQLVAGHINPGLGGLLARHARVLGAPVEAAVRDWVETVHPEARAVELDAGADWSALHAGGGALPALRWPGDTPTGEPELRLADLELTHDAERDTLTLRDRGGRPVAPVYLGVAPPHMIRGPLRLLLTLADPWVAGQRFGHERGPWESGPPGPGGHRARAPPDRRPARPAARALADPARRVPAPGRGRPRLPAPGRPLAPRPRPAGRGVHDDRAAGVRPLRRPPQAGLGRLGQPARARRRRAPDRCGRRGRQPRRGAAGARAAPGPRRRRPPTRRRVRRPSRLAASGRGADRHPGRRMSAEWLYLQLYPRDLAAMDALVRGGVAEAVRAARAAAPIDRWHFLRFLDEDGPHVRLRLRGSADALGAAQAAMAPALAGAWVRLELYEPELDKYGGPAGVAAAERVFEASSELALAALARPCAEASRRGLALDLMRRAAGVFLAAGQHAAFWAAYARYWDAPGEVRAAAPAPRLDVAAADYTGALADCALAIDPRHACFHHVHLTNNRLGVYPREEALLAAQLMR